MEDGFEAIILAGGLGTRLASKLDGIPKAMAPVAGRPFLEILVNQLKCVGCSRALLSVGHLRSVIQDHFGASFRGLPLEYVVEEVPLGTGGAIRKALLAANAESVLVLNGDTFLQLDYAAMLRFHAAERSAITMAITYQPNIARYGGVLLEGNRIVGYVEKGRAGPGWINAGIYVLPKAMAWPPTLSEKFSFEVDFLVPEVGRLAPSAYKVDGFFLDIGVPEDLDRAQTELAGFGL
jgi:D-glycero-alpha-D-manno-heptose 1-phosphate guanylyltransferase